MVRAISLSGIYTAMQAIFSGACAQENALQFELSELPVPMVFATHRTIRDCNQRFADLFAYERDELIDASFHKLYPKFDDFVRIGKMWKANLAGGNVYYDERIMMRSDQTQFWCSVHGTSRTPDDPFAEALYCFEPFRNPSVISDRGLTPRQLQIVTLVAQGKRNREIAIELAISQRTVEAHRARLMQALGVKNAAEMIAWFHRHG